jgi:hypothetical protein
MHCRKIITQHPFRAIVCGSRMRAPKCSVPGCNRPHTRLCDQRLARGTCDAKLCSNHAIRMGVDSDLCPAHAPR